MQLKTISKWIVIIGVLFISCIKLFVRPYVHVPAGMQLVVDVAPNFIGSFLVPFFACCLLKKYLPVENASELKLVCGLGLLLGIVNEYLQLIPVFGRTFDYFDIIASGMATILGYNSFAMLMNKFATVKNAPQLV